MTWLSSTGGVAFVTLALRLEVSETANGWAYAGMAHASTVTRAEAEAKTTERYGMRLPPDHPVEVAHHH
jgi:uncharacterized protein YcnI